MYYDIVIYFITSNWQINLKIYKFYCDVCHFTAFSSSKLFFWNKAENLFPQFWKKNNPKTSHVKFKTICQKLSDSMVSRPCLSNVEEGSPAEQTLISLCSISQPAICCENVWVYAPSAGIVQTGWRANQPASPLWTGPCQLWSCREDEWMPSTRHYWGHPCAPSVALERGHNLFLSA